MSRAERRRISATCPAVSSGRTVQIHAAAPATSGEEKLVPEAVRQFFPRALATMISSPGAARSTYDDRLENGATFPDRSVAATVVTCGNAAG